MASTSISSTATGATRGVVLVVAKPYDRELLCQMLSSAGFEPTVSDGTGTPDVDVELRQPVAVVLSLRLTGADAMEILARIRAGEHGASVAVVLVGDASLQMTLGDAVRLGANQLVLRPLDADLLVAKLGSVISRPPMSEREARKLTTYEVEAAELAEQFEGVTWAGGVKRGPSWAAVMTEVMEEEQPAAEQGASSTVTASPQPPPANVPLAKVQLAKVQLAKVPAGRATPIKELGPPPSRTQREDETADGVHSERAARPISALHDELQREIGDLDRRLFPQAEDPFELLDDQDGVLGEDGDLGPLEEIDLERMGVDTFVGASLGREAEPADEEPSESTAESLVEGPDADDDGEVTRDASTGSAEPVEQLAAAGSLELEGDLSQLELPRLLARITHSGFTGQLRCQRDEAVKTVTVEDGHPVFATSSEIHDRLTHLLFREAKLTREDLDACDEEVRRGRRIGAVLIDRGLIKQDELFPLVRRHVAEVVYSLFAWSAGRYQLRAGEPAPEERIRLEVHPWSLIYEGIRRKLGLDRLVELVGPASTRISLEPGAEIQTICDAAGLGSREREALGMLEGARTVGQLVDRAGGDALGTYHLLYALLAIGVIATDAELTTSSEAQTRGLAIDRQRLQAKLAQVREADYFSLLGVPAGASGYEIGLACRRIKAELDPAAIPPQLAEKHAAELEQLYLVIEEARRILGDPALRRVYRESL